MSNDFVIRQKSHSLVRSGPSRSKAKVVKVLHYWVHQNLNFISTHNDKIETHIAKFCTTGAWPKASLEAALSEFVSAWLYDYKLYLSNKPLQL